MAKLATLADAFTGTTINTVLWSNITGGTASLDQVNDLVILQQPTVSGTTNTFGSNAAFDATSSSIYAEVGPAANGNGNTKTIFKVMLDANNWASLRLAAGVFLFIVETAGVDAITTLPTYDPNAHGWWRLRESGGTWFGDVSADGYNWTNLASAAHSWAVTAVTFVFQASAGGTEVAGNVATIQHVNTMAGGPFNINWPTLEEAWAPRWNCNGGDVPLDRYINLTPRTESTSSVSRGRQYELDQVQAGTASLTVQNKDGLLDPTNVSGPWFGHIMPYQPYRKRAQWPPTRNLLTQVQATAGDLGGQPLGSINASNNGPSIFSATDSSHGSFVTSATAWQGGTVMQFAVTTGATIPSGICYTPQPAITPGLSYSVSLQVRNITAASSVQVYAYLLWWDASQNQLSASAGTTATLTGSASASWTAVSVTGTAPANAAYVHAGLRLAATPSANCSVQVDGWQLEQAAAASTWTCPGVWNPIFGGFVERWPSTWDMGGTYGLVKPTAVDGMALLSQVVLKDPLSEEISNHSPRYLYTLGDPSGSTTATDSTGQNPAVPLAFSKYGSGGAAFGTAITAANTTTGVYTGSSDSVLTFSNPNPGAGGNQASTFLSLNSAGIKGPANPSLWTRMVAFRYTGGVPASSADIWAATDASHSAGSVLTMYINSSGHFAWALAGPTSGPTGSATSFSVADSNWHLGALAYDGANSLLVFYLDGVSIGGFVVGPQFAPTGIVGDSIGCYLDVANGSAASNNWKGDVSYVTEFPTLISASDMTGIYNAWKSSCSGESSDARYSRILRYSGYLGPSSIQAGQTTSMGPAAIGGQDALSALQAVVDTENGAHYADRYGNVTFRSRAARYNALTPVYTFGERADLGEWPYEDDQNDFDPTHLSNLIQITQSSTGQIFSAQDTVSQTNYFPRSLQRSINASSALECQDAANYLLSRYRNAATRVSTLVLHPSANPAMWPVCLSLELGTRVRVMRRPQGAPAITLDVFVENIQVDMDNQGDATWTLQCSPVDTTPYGVFSSFHTTLNGTISSGVGSVTINSGADSTNTAASQLGVGQQLVLGQNTANQETVTVKGVAATSPGWATCVITLVANTTKGHTAGDVVCEPLPSGTTDPTTWDAASKFDAVAFSY